MLRRRGKRRRKKVRDISDKMKTIIIGMPGSGKGTQAEMLARHYHIAHISTGDLLRAELNRNTQLAKKVFQLTSEGKLVPDSIINKMVKSRISMPDCKRGFILDGYPRNLAQAQFLDSRIGIDLAILISLEDEVAKARIMGRLYCPKCSAVYNMITGPKPRRDTLCDTCKVQLVRRADDSEDSFWHRVSIYHRITERVAEHYSEKCMLITIDGNRSASEVHRELIKRIDEFFSSKYSDQIGSQ
ncbi:MAG: nucleoside monophosphate kinase [Candidatus Woesearchaeota archaeon]